MLSTTVRVLQVPDIHIHSPPMLSENALGSREMQTHSLLELASFDYLQRDPLEAAVMGRRPSLGGWAWDAYSRKIHQPSAACKELARSRYLVKLSSSPEGCSTVP